MKKLLFLFMTLTFNANAMNSQTNTNQNKDLSGYKFARRLNSDALNNGELVEINKKTMQILWAISIVGGAVVYLSRL